MARRARSTRSDAHWKSLAAQRLTENFALHTSSSLQPGSTYALQHGLKAGTKFSEGGLSVEALRMSNFIPGDQRVTTDRTAYSDLIIRSGSDINVGFMVGQFQETWARLREAGDRGIEWFVEVIIGLSAERRNRCVRVTLNCPDNVLPDTDATMLSAHIEAMKEQRKHYSVRVKTWQHLFAEEDSRFGSQDLPETARDRNIHPDGLVRLLEDICTMSGEGWVVDGDPIIRVSLESATGMVFRGSHLRQPLYRGVLYGWLYDIIEFTSGAGRGRLWSPARNRFEAVGVETIRRLRAEARAQARG